MGKRVSDHKILQTDVAVVLNGYIAILIVESVEVVIARHDGVVVVAAAGSPSLTEECIVLQAIVDYERCIHVAIAKHGLLTHALEEE